MKKTYAIVAIIFMVIIVLAYMNVKSYQDQQKEVAKFNLIYEEYNSDDLNGLDVATVINKAINNNEKYEIEKDSDGLYIEDDEYSIKVYVKMILNDKTYPMEKINAMEITSFIEYFGSVDFKCTDITYHKKGGRISSITFESTEY